MSIEMVVNGPQGEAAGQDARPLVLLPTSHGGHLRLLRAVQPALAEHRRLWITPSSRQADSLIADGERVLLIADHARQPALVMRAAARALRLVHRERPAVVVTAGADVAAPYAAVARAMGVPLVLLETMARTDAPSATIRILAPLAHRVFVQWPGMERHHRRAELCRPVLLDGVGERPARTSRRGTFVTVGSDARQFRRLAERALLLVEQGVLPAPAQIQAGPLAADPAIQSRARAAAVKVVADMPQAEHIAALSSAEVVVCHGGVAAMTGALQAGTVPFVLPRLRAEGEHVDDHQQGTFDQFERMGLARALPLSGSQPLSSKQPPTLVLPGADMIIRLRDVVDELTAPR